MNIIDFALSKARVFVGILAFIIVSGASKLSAGGSRMSRQSSIMGSQHGSVHGSQIGTPMASIQHSVEKSIDREELTRLRQEQEEVVLTIM